MSAIILRYLRFFDKIKRCRSGGIFKAVKKALAFLRMVKGLMKADAAQMADLEE